MSANLYAILTEIVIEDARYAVNVNASDGTFTIASEPVGKTILTAGN